MTIDRATAETDAQQLLLDSLLYVVSHDLRSPLLTMTLSAELIETAMESGSTRSDSTALAIQSMKQGAADMERMLQTLMLLSRARRRQLEPGRGALGLILGGYEVEGGGPELARRVARVEPLQVREMLDAIAGDGGLRVLVTLHADAADLEVEVPELEHGPTPMHAVATSLKQYAGTVVETLAVGQAFIERQGGCVIAEPGRLIIRLPLIEDAS